MNLQLSGAPRGALSTHRRASPTPQSCFVSGVAWDVAPSVCQLLPYVTTAGRADDGSWRDTHRGRLERGRAKQRRTSPATVLCSPALVYMTRLSSTGQPSNSFHQHDIPLQKHPATLTDSALLSWEVKKIASRGGQLMFLAF